MPPTPTLKTNGRIDSKSQREATRNHVTSNVWTKRHLEFDKQNRYGRNQQFWKITKALNEIYKSTVSKRDVKASCTIFRNLHATLDSQLVFDDLFYKRIAFLKNTLATCRRSDQFKSFHTFIQPFELIGKRLPKPFSKTRFTTYNPEPNMHCSKK